jgi:hypothetical protein
LIAIRHCLAAVSLAALLAFAPAGWIAAAKAQDGIAALVAKPVSLPDMVLGSAKAPVTITEYSSMSCPHCAAFAEVEICRHRQGAFRVPGIPARHQARGGLDAGALHRQ